MIQIFAEYWRPFLYSDGMRASGLVVTLWLLAASIVLGFCAAVPLACARVSRNRWLSTPVRIYTYVFRGTPLYVQLLLLYTGMYSLEFVRTQSLLEAFFRSGFNCAILAFALNTCALIASGTLSPPCPLESFHVTTKPLFVSAVIDGFV